MRVRWSAVPGGFVYTVKLSRLVTHRKRPGEPRAAAPLVVTGPVLCVRLQGPVRDRNACAPRNAATLREILGV